jgi:hypothetical protein
MGSLVLMEGQFLDGKVAAFEHRGARKSGIKWVSRTEVRVQRSIQSNMGIIAQELQMQPWPKVAILPSTTWAIEMPAQPAIFHLSISLSRRTLLDCRTTLLGGYPLQKASCRGRRATAAVARSQREIGRTALWLAVPHFLSGL